MAHKPKLGESNIYWHYYALVFVCLGFAIRALWVVYRTFRSSEGWEAKSAIFALMGIGGFAARNMLMFLMETSYADLQRDLSALVLVLSTIGIAKLAKPKHRIGRDE